MKKIVTFGSCMARWTAQALAQRGGYELISAVYHNRSDQWLQYFGSGRKPSAPDFSEFLEAALSANIINAAASPDENPVKILKNQMLEGMGLNLPPEIKGVNLFEALRRDDVALILMDNHMDLGARLWLADGGPLFMRQDFLPESFYGLQLSDLLAIDDSVSNFTSIASIFRQRCPKARLVFLNFPSTAYPGTSERHLRTQQFAKAFSPAGVDIMPLMDVPSRYFTESPSHFKREAYEFFAGYVECLIRGR